jgi:hypothetical protein
MALLNKLVKKITAILRKAFEAEVDMPTETRLDLDKAYGRQEGLEE